ncbi:maleylpyruvate isomerase family mycothiol-dependent enzyme [Gordonia sp. LSe1-13]|uniref:Maleylpyruvate isomerase family mycothiol-dependent enzyme n=1 Tax=Gordonia sesuvii TaxID=3116777 RepID=A0ABU7MGW9_9ACTN|nr:maleylpyruvate isomerase family mycothiol-dependent enzyme [Gordonia sp. LSe1-13]
MAKTVLPIAPTVDALVAQWATLERVVTPLSDDEWAAPSILPGWSVADVIAHVVGTESLLEGRDVPTTRDVTALEHVRNPIGELNERWLDHYRPVTRADVMAAYAEIVGVRTEALCAMTQNDFDGDALTPAGPDTYGRFMRIRVFDCWIHEIDIRDSTDGSAPSDDIPAAVALDEIATSLPYVVGKRARTPKGTSVLFAIEGLGARQIRIYVDDRAATVDAFPDGDDSADVTLTLDSIDLGRLVGGRKTANPARVAIAGDRAIGEAIVAKLDYVM